MLCNIKLYYAMICDAMFCYPISFNLFSSHLIMYLRTLQEHDVRLHMGLSEDAFASRLGGRARDLLQNV